jgi:hypothetical protein
MLTARQMMYWSSRHILPAASERSSLERIEHGVKTVNGLILTKYSSWLTTENTTINECNAALNRDRDA